VNVLLCVVRADPQKHLRCLSRAAESIAVGDTIDAVVRRAQKWNMLPTQVLLINCCEFWNLMDERLESP